MSLNRHHLLIFLSLILVALSGPGCSDEPEEPSGVKKLTVTIQQAEPTSGFAPLEVLFTGWYEEEDIEEFFNITWDFGDGTQVTDQLEVTHTFTQPGTYSVSLSIKTESDSYQGSDSIDIEIFPQAELTLRNLVAGPRELLTDTSLDISFDIENQAAPFESTFDIALFLSKESGLDANDTDEMLILGHEEMSGMDGDGFLESKNLSVRIPDYILSGVYYVGAFADINDEIGEVREDNNIVISDYTIKVRNPGTDGPDLLVKNLTLSPRYSYLLNNATLSFTIENQGSEPAVLFYYSIYLSAGDTDLDSEDIFVSQGEISGAGAGQAISVDNLWVTLDTPVETEGEYYFLVRVDSEDDIQETNEENNIGIPATPIEVRREALEGIDIAVTAFSIEPVLTYLGGNVEANLEIINTGTEQTNSFFCAIYLSTDDRLETSLDTKLTNINIRNLAGGEMINLTQLVNIPGFLMPGTFRAFALCDSSRVVPEQDETNNVLLYSEPISITVTAVVDLAFDGDIAIDPDIVANDSNIAISFRVCNTGSSGAGPSNIEVFLSSDAQVDSEDISFINESLPPFNAGECRDFILIESVSCLPWQDTYQVLLWLDPLNTLPEVSDINNVQSSLAPLVITDRACSCEDDLFEPNNSTLEAANLFVGQTPGLALCEETLSGDWYAVQLNQNDSLVCTLTLEDASVGDLDLLLYEADGATLIDSATSSGSIDSVYHYLAPMTSRVLLYVGGKTGIERNYYSLDLTVETPTEGSDLLALAPFVGDLTPKVGDLVELRLSLFNVGQEPVGAFSVGVYLSADESIEPEDDTLLVLAPVSELGALEEVELQLTPTIPSDVNSGTYWIGVILDVHNDVDEDNENNNEYLSEPLEVDAGCWDIFEPNGPDQSTVIIPTTLPENPDEPEFVGESLAVCKDDEDFYQICLEHGTRLLVTLEFEHDEGDMDLDIIDELGDVRYRSHSAEDQESVDIPYLVGDQCLTIRVFLIDSQFNPDHNLYNLIVASGPGDPFFECDASFEPNESIENASSMISASQVDYPLSICPESDIDYYSVLLSFGASVTLYLDTEDTDLRATLYDPQQRFMGTIFHPQDERLEIQAYQTGEHILKVFPGHDAGHRTDYNLVLEGMDGVDLIPLELRAAQSVLVPGQELRFEVDLANLGSVASEAFGYQILLSEDDLITTEDLLLDSFISDPLTPFAEVILSGKVDIPEDFNPLIGYLGVVVDSESGIIELNENNNSAYIQVEFTAVCEADSYETSGGGSSNNYPLFASTISFLESYDATICADDVDWWIGSTEGEAMLEVSIAFLHESGDLDLRVFSPTLDMVAESNTLDDNEQIFYSHSGGPFFIQVRGFEISDQNSYSLTVEAL